MAKICLVSCVSEKQPGPVAAADLYTSALFRKAKQYATERADLWYILSAEHGLLKPDTVVSRYDKTLNRMRTVDRRAWASDVLDSLLPSLHPGDEVTFLAGKRYREFLADALESRGIVVSVPMAGLPIGKQLRWLNEATQGECRHE